MNGVFVRVRDPAPLCQGDVIRVGHQLFGLHIVDHDTNEIADVSTPKPLGSAPVPEVWGFLRQRITESQDGFVFPLYHEQTTLGRAGTDLVFSHDPYVSSEHAKIIWNGAQATLVDQHSRNGSFIRLSCGVDLLDGDSFLAGQRLFKFRA